MSIRLSKRHFSIFAFAVSSSLLACAVQTESTGTTEGAASKAHEPPAHVARGRSSTLQADAPASPTPLSSRGGPVMHNVRAHLIFWLPPGRHFAVDGDDASDNRYEYWLQTFLGDFPSSSLFNILRQYGDNQGTVQGASFADVTLYNAPYPHRGDATDPLFDGDIQGAIRAVWRSSWSAGTEDMYFVFTAANVQSCQGSDLSSCTFAATPTTKTYCAYHSSFSSSPGSVVYANMPSALSLGDCTPPSTPNDPVADATLNVMSHELSEAITDPLGSGWVDASGNEIGDKCAWDFPGPGDDTETVVNGRRYILQAEWNDAANGCTMSMPAITNITPNSGPNGGGTTIEIDGVGFDTAGGTTFRFGGAAASIVSCSSSTRCSVTTPNVGASSSAQTLPVTATVRGFSSTATPTNVFTFTAGPTCNAQESCTGIAFGFPNLVITCPPGSVESFYTSWGSPDAAHAVSANSFTTGMNNVGGTVYACDPSTKSCTAYSIYEPNASYCGPVPPPPSPPATCNGAPKPITKCSATWRCCGVDGWNCGVCP